MARQPRTREPKNKSKGKSLVKCRVCGNETRDYILVNGPRGLGYICTGHKSPTA